MGNIFFNFEAFKIKLLGKRKRNEGLNWDLIWPPGRKIEILCFPFSIKIRKSLNFILLFF
jgi:hypothetical protein